MKNSTSWMIGCSVAAISMSPAAGQTVSSTSASETKPATAPVEVGDIVVTAQRRVERLQNVGVAVAAYAGTQLRDEGLHQATDIAKFTPGITASVDLGGQGQHFSIRGVTQSDFNDALEGPVAVYVDDSYIASQQGQALALFDVSRVEALKGPQGTLFGRNATGGLVNFIVNQPTLDKFGGYVDATYGRFDEATVEAALNLPVSDKVAFRGSIFFKRNDNFYKNDYPAGVAAGAPLTFGGPAVDPRGENLGGERQIAGRLQLLVKPTDDISIRLSGAVSDEHQSTAPYFSEPSIPVVDAQGRVVNAVVASPTDTRSAIGPDGNNFYDPSVLPFQAFLYSPNGDGHRVAKASWFGYTQVPGKLNISEDLARRDTNYFKVYNAGAHVDFSLGDVQVAYVSSFFDYKKNFLVEPEGSPVDVYAFGTHSSMKTFSNELRFSGTSSTFNWTGGLYQLRVASKAAYGLLGPTGSAFADFFGLGATGVDPVDLYGLKDNSVSGFGQIAWEFVPKITFVLGGRVIQERQSYHLVTVAAANSSDYTVDTSPVLFSLSAPFSAKRTEYLWSGKAQLEYRPTHQLLLYAGVNRGVKAGNFNAKLFDGSPNLEPSQIPYKPEELVSIEGGAKLTGAGSRFTLDAAAYHYIYHGYQSFVFSNASGFVQNENARTTGAEIEASYRLLRGLRVTVSGAYNHAEVLNLAIAPGVFRNTRPTFAPRYQASGRLEYELPNAVFGGRLSLGYNIGYQSSEYQNARNFDADRIKGRSLSDVYANLRFDNGLSVGSYVNNVFNKRYVDTGFDLSNTSGVVALAYGRLISWGVRAGYRF